MSNDVIYNFINQSVKAAKAAEIARLNKEEAEANQHKTELQEQFEQRLLAEFGSEIYDALNIEYEYTPNADSLMYAFFYYHVESHIPPIRWKITAHDYRRQFNGWNVRGIYEGNGVYYETIGIGELSVTLGTAIAEISQKVIKIFEATQHQLLKQIEQKENWEKELERRKQQAILDEQNEISVHNTLYSLVQKNNKQALENVWKYPQGLEFHMFKLTWQTGTVYEDGNHSPTMDSGYVFEDGLDANGFIDVFDQYGNKRTLKLNINVHYPTWERYRVLSVENLPNCFQNYFRVRHENVGVLRWQEYRSMPDSFLKDEKKIAPIFCVLEDKDSYYTYTETFEDILIPTKWMQEYIDDNFR